MNEQEKQTKKLYQKWWVWVIGFIFIMLAWNRIDNYIDNISTKEIPNVMSINYTDAENVLKEQGFKTTSVETDASSVLSNDTYNRSVKKGEVFKVNNNTNPNYYLTTKDKKVTIYYAKDDYVYEEPTEGNNQTTPASITKDEPKKEEPTSTDTEAWRQFLKDYEAWVDRYIEIVKKYKDNPSDIGLISEYGKLAAETVEWADKAEKYQDELENGDFSAEVLKEYIDTLARITQKIAEVAY